MTASASTTASGSWPQPRYGGGRSGWNPAETAVTSGTVSRLRPTWVVPGDEEYSQDSPIIAGGVSYTICADDAQRLGGEICARTLSTGALRWRLNATAESIAISGQDLIVSGGTTVSARRLSDGRLIWSTQVVSDTDEVEGEVGVYGGQVFVATTGQHANRYIALNATTGKINWVHAGLPTPGVPIFSFGHNQLFTYERDASVAAWSTLDGHQLWVTNHEAGQPPTVVNGRLFTASSTDTASLGGTTVSAYPEDGCGADICSPLWSTTIGDGGFIGDLAMADGVLLGSNGGHVVALDAPTGTRLWTSTGTDILDDEPVVAGDVDYQVTADGNLEAFALHGCGAGHCRPLWTSRISCTSDCQDLNGDYPSVVDGVLEVTGGTYGHHYLYGFDLTGNPALTVPGKVTDITVSTAYRDIEWTDPAGLLPITTYELRCDGHAPFGADTSGDVWSKASFSPGRHTCRIAAINAAGRGPWSAAVSFTV